MSESKTKSRTKWEKSHFGGYTRLLWDYPDIDIPQYVKWTRGPFDSYETKCAGPYSYQKLISIFLYQATRNEERLNALNNLFIDNGAEFFIRNENGLDRFLKKQFKDEKELIVLFEHYQEEITNTYFSVRKSNPTERDREVEDGDGNFDTINFRIIDKDILKDALAQIKKEKSLYEKCGTVSNEELKNKTDFINVMAGALDPLTAQETKLKDLLVRLLDINLDPTEDKIQNLRNGKLETSHIATALSGNPYLFSRIEKDQTTKPFSVVILGDESGSMMEDIERSDTTRSELQKSIIKILYAAFSDIIKSEDIFVYGHSGQMTPDIFVYQDRDNQKDFYRKISKSDAKEENYDGPVIEKVYEKIRSVTDNNILFISLSDGCPCGWGYGSEKDLQDLSRVIEKCKRDGFVTVGIGIGNDSPVKQLYKNNITIDSTKEDYLVRLVRLINDVVKREFQT